jgi:hypothetical protein
VLADRGCDSGAFRRELVEQHHSCHTWTEKLLEPVQNLLNMTAINAKTAI